MIFRHAMALTATDKKTTTMPNGTQVKTDGRTMARFFSDHVGMKSAETAIMLDQASFWLRETAPVDQSAKNLIASMHSQTTNGHLNAGQQAPTVPAALITLQQKRDALTLKYMGAMQTAMGTDRFNIIDRAMRDQIHVTHSAVSGTFAKKLP